MTSQLKFTIKLFYSYSHKDEQHRERMERSLVLLRDQDGVLDDWSDHRILPGENIPKAIREQIKKTDICVFMLSQDFIASEACREEWRLAGEVPSVIRVPVILSECSWKDMEGVSQLKALPEDAKPIKSFGRRDQAWNHVYDGLRNLIGKLRESFTIRPEFREEMEKTEFISKDRVGLASIFVFPRLSYTATNNEDDMEQMIKDKNQLLKIKYALIHGEELSGKSGLCRHLFLSLVDEGKPVIYVDLDNVKKDATLNVFREAYHHQFYGEYSLWEKQNGKIIILDNLSPRGIDYVALAIESFDQVIITVSTDTFLAYYKDDDRLVKFREIKILSLTHNKQEKLIRKRAELLGKSEQVLDGEIDQIENRVNTIIINNKILPRYPFYVLSILQTYEDFMPDNLSITSYGHCYYILILSHLIKSGISKADDEINASLNFLENMAFKIYQSHLDEYYLGYDSLAEFFNEYKKDYIIKDSTLRRISGQEYGVITSSGGFKNSYMYYFFLGKFLARNMEQHGEIIQRMLDKNHITSNCLTLLFVIHHTSDEQIIEDILLRTMCALDKIEPSTLDREDVRIFEDVVKAIPEQILSSNTVEAERERQRIQRDREEEFNGSHKIGNNNDDEPIGRVNDVYRILKNNEIFGQILRNKYGSLKRERISEIIETIGDGGLRLIRLFLSKKAINNYAAYIHERNPDYDIKTIRKVMRLVSFLWTMGNIEKIVWELNKPEIRSLVEEVVNKRNTPAYELIGYFLRLDTILEFSNRDKEELRTLWSKHRYSFFRKVISIRTQIYLNTHQVKGPIEQAICSLLNIKYRAKVKSLE